MALRKRTLLILLSFTIALLGGGVWFGWLRAPSRNLPAEFIRKCTCENARLTRLLVSDKDQVFAADAAGNVFETSFIDSVAKAVPPGGDAAATMLAMSSDGLLLVGDDSGLLRTWQLPDLKFKSIESPKVPTTCAVFRSADGNQQIFLGLSDGRLLVIDETGSKLIKTKLGGFKSMALSPDQKTIAAGGTNGLITFFDAAKVESLATLKHHQAEVASLAWSTDGQTLASGDWNGAVATVSAVSHQVIATGQQPDAVSKLLWLGEHLVTASWDGRIRRWNVTNKELKVTNEFDTQSVLHDLSINSSTDTIVTVSGTDEIEFWKLP